jgi:hypothetical protein
MLVLLLRQDAQLCLCHIIFQRVLDGNMLKTRLAFIMIQVVFAIKTFDQ